MGTGPPRIWLRYMDDTFSVHKAEHSQQFLTHLDSLNPHIQLTTETSNQQGSLPFLDTLVFVCTDGSLITTVFRKPTHMDQYLRRDSHHSLTNKYSVYNTLTHRAQTVWTDFGQEYQHIKTTFSRCKVPGLGLP